LTGKDGKPLSLIQAQQEIQSRAQVMAEAVKLLAEQGFSVRLPTGTEQRSN